VTVLLNTTLDATRASGLSAPVSVLVSVATVQQGSCWIASPVVAASRCGLNVDDRPKADLESVRSLGSHSGSQTARSTQHVNGLTWARHPSSERLSRPSGLPRRQIETYGFVSVLAVLLGGGPPGSVSVTRCDSLRIWPFRACPSSDLSVVVADTGLAHQLA
jgi:hypothetical protein